jgi:hypothetical protein
MHDSSMSRGAIALAFTLTSTLVLGSGGPLFAAPPAPTKATSASPASSPAVQSLAAHLQRIGAKMYGAYWCPHCTNQKDLFGEPAFRTITYIECDPKGSNPKPDLCRAAKIKGYPTWEIGGKFYPGTQSLEDLARLSGYRGSMKF